MKATIRQRMYFRDAPVAGEILGHLFPDDVVYGTVANRWLSFSQIHRATGVIEKVAGCCSVAEALAKLDDEPEPPHREVAHVFVVFTNGDALMDERRVMDAVKAAL